MHILQEIAVLASSELHHWHGLEGTRGGSGIDLLQVRKVSDSVLQILTRVHQLWRVSLCNHLHIREATRPLHAQGADCACVLQICRDHTLTS